MPNDYVANYYKLSHLNTGLNKYDATGKKTNINELDVIGEELKKFINSI